MKLRNLLAIFALTTHLFAAESITGHMWEYRKICAQALENENVFANFRRMRFYNPILEVNDKELGHALNKYLLTFGSKDDLFLLTEIDKIGNPFKYYYDGIGDISVTSLRYMVVGREITSMFDLPTQPKIVEIGGGFGGQCFILSHLLPFSKYYIYDIKEPLGLIEKVMKTLSVKDVISMEPFDRLPEEEIDLVISNYAFSECDYDMQLEYFENIIKKSKNGYMIYNHTSHFYNITSMSVFDLAELLKAKGFMVSIQPESAFSHENNLLLTWRSP